MNVVRKILLLVLSILLFSEPSFATNLNISDESIKPIELTQQKSQARIIALANGSAEVVAALGFRDSLVGRDIESTTPELKAIPIVTSGHQVIAEKIISLKPTLVLIDAGVGPASAIKSIKKAKIKIVIITQAWNLNDMYLKVKQIGLAIGESHATEILNAKIKESILHAQRNLDWKPKIAFLYLRGTSSIYLMGGKGSGADSLIKELGGIDVGASTLRNPFNPLTSEALIKSNPDVILLMTNGLKSVGGEEGLLKLPGVKLTNAGKSRRFLSVDDSLLLSFGPRTPSLLVKMSDALRQLK